MRIRWILFLCLACCYNAFAQPCNEPPPIANDVFICSGSAVNLSASGPTGGYFEWFNTASGGTPLIISPDYTTPVLTANTIYYVQITVNGCTSTRKPVLVTVYPIPPPPSTIGTTICSGTTAVLTASTANGTINWYSSASSGTVLATGNTFTTPVLFNTTTFYTQTVINGCGSIRSPVTATVTPSPAIPAVSGAIICSGSSVTLTAISPGGNYEWFDAATGGNSIGIGASYTTPVLTASTTYYVQTTISGCISGRAAVNVNVPPTPATPVAADVSVCTGGSAVLTATGSTGTYRWYDAASGGNLLVTNDVFVTPSLNSSRTYYVETMLNGCISARAPVQVAVVPPPSTPTASGTSVCPDTFATLTASTASGTLEWYDSPTGGSLLGTGATFNTPALSTATTYYVQASNGVCSSSRIAVSVSVTTVPDPEFQYPSSTFSSTGPNPTPIINVPEGGTFSATPAGLVFISTTTGQVNVGASAFGSYFIKFTSNGPCPANKSLLVHIGDSDPVATFGYIEPFCQNEPNPSPFFFDGGAAGSFSSTPSGLVFINTTTGEINLKTSLPGTYVVTNTFPPNGAFQGTSAMYTITINPAVIVNAGPDQTIAKGSSVSLSGAFANASGARWSGGLGTFSDPTLQNTVYTPASGESNITLYYTSNPTGPCGSKADVVIITVNPDPTAKDVMICNGASAVLTATAPGGLYEWFDVPSGGNPLGSGPAFLTPVLTAETTYYVQTTLAGITSGRTPVKVSLNPIPLSPTAASQLICYGSSTTLSASGADSYRWYDSPVGGNLISSLSSYPTPVLITNTTFYVEGIVNGCTSGRTAVEVTMKPIIMVTSGSLLSLCSGLAQNYEITSNSQGTTYIWSRAAVSGISNLAVSDQTTDFITETLINTTNTEVNVTYIITPLTNGCIGIPFNYVVIVYPIPVVTSISKEVICNSTAHNYAVQFNVPGTGFSWSRLAVPGIVNTTVIGQRADVIREILTNTTLLPIDVTYTFTSSTANCAGPSFSYVVTVNPTTTITSPPSNSICSRIQQNYVMTSNIPQATYSWTRLAVAGISNPAAIAQTSGTITEALINTGSSAVVVTYQIAALVNGCPGTVFNYQVTVLPQPATPVIASNSPVCSANAIQLTTASVPGATYLWTGPASFTSSLQNPVINGASQANAGVYSLIVTLNGCVSASGTTDVSITEPSVTSAGNNQVICFYTDIVQLSGSVTGGTTTGLWTSSGSGSFNPSNTALNASYLPSIADKNLGIITLTLTSTNNSNCNPSSSSSTITIQPIPIVEAGSDQDVCTQTSGVSLNGIVTNANGGIWTTSGSGSFSPSNTQINAIYIPGSSDISSGSVTLTLTSTGNGSCNAVNDALVLTFIPPPVITAGTDQILFLNRTYTLQPSSSDPNVQYLWTPNLNISDNTVKNPVITAIDNQVYTLTVTDVRGCISTDEVFIKVLKPLTIPNTFTPNGDGINDTWNIPELLDYPNPDLTIYNRHGEKLFYSNGYNQGWNGYTMNGRALPVATYYYLIHTNFEGMVRSGSITIIK